MSDASEIPFESVFDYPGFYDRVATRFLHKEERVVFVELGAYVGESTVYLALALAREFVVNPFALYAVDLWTQDHCNSRWGNDQAQRYEEMLGPDGFYAAYFRRVQASGARPLIHDVRMCSWNAAELFDDGTVDFVFVDACHDYYAVRRDLEAWCPKIRPGGMIAGHEWRHDAVKRAVGDVLPAYEIEAEPTDNNCGVWACVL